MSVSQLIQDIDSVVNASPDGIPEDERAALLASCERLKGTIETPLETTVRVVFGAHQAIALRLGIDMKLFDAAASLAAKDGKIRSEELASATNADPLLIVRIMRMLVGMGIFNEVKLNTYASTPLASVYVTGSPLTEAVIHITSHIDILSRLPDYFTEKGFKNPGDAYNGPFQYAMRTDLHYFDWLKSNPKHQTAFNTVMGISRMSRGEEWFEFYPVEEKLQVEASSQPLLVDVGGGLGHDLVAFQQKFPTLPGKLILQDLPIVIDNAKDLPTSIEAIKYDFFTPQPVKGAKAYYLRTVLHDWPDQQARIILEHIHASMTKDSILLINENALPEVNVPLYPAELDLSMMAIFSSLDRTLMQFKELLASAGFTLVQVWTPKVMVPGSGTLFEAVPKM